MTINYQDIFDTLGQILQLALPVGVYIGIVERLVSLALDAMLDRVRRSERL